MKRPSSFQNWTTRLLDKRNGSTGPKGWGWSSGYPIGWKCAAEEIARMREYSEKWRGQMASLPQRIVAAAIEPPPKVR